MNHLISKLIGKHQFRVYEDIDIESTLADFDASLREEIRESIDEGRLTAYGVKEFAPCGCNCPKCDGWKEVDACWGFICANPDEAIEEYTYNTGGKPCKP